YNGWEENAKKMDFYQLTCAFFNDELKKNPKVSTIIQTEYLDEISKSIGDIELKISDIKDSIEAYYELYKEFIPIVEKLLETVEEIKDHTSEIKVDVKEIKETQNLQQETIQKLAEAVEKKFITGEELVASEKYRNLTQEIEDLKKDIDNIVLQIK